MSYFKDYIEPYIGMIPNRFTEDRFNEDILSGDTIPYAYTSISKETEKAYLFYFKSVGEAWVPKSMVDRLELNIVHIYEEFKLKYINQIKEIKMEFLNE